MDLVGLSWFDFDTRSNGAFNYGGADVHLLRDATKPSLDLTPMLRLTFITVDPTTHLKTVKQVPATDILTVAVELNGGITFAPQYPFTQAKHAIQVHPVTGVVTASANAAAFRISNFIVKATAVPAQATPPGVGTTQTATIRFHLHDAFKPETFRVSPDGLTAGQGGSAQRFTVMGEFSDGVLADLTNHPDLKWELFQDDAAGNPQPVVLNPATQQYDVPGFSLTQAGLFQATGPVQRPVRVKASIPTLNVVSSTAKAEGFGEIFIGDPWVRAIAARHLAGPGPNKRATVPNLLLLSEGFRLEDQDPFYQLAQAIVQRIRDAKTALPMDRLLRDDRLNVFAAFVPSRQAGVSVLNQLAFIPGGQDVTVSSVPTADDSGSAIIDSVEELLYSIGLPIPADAQQPGESSTQVFNRFRDRLLDLFPDLLSSRLPVSSLPGLQGPWLAVARRTFAVEHDTAFGVAVGARPQATGDDPQNLDWNANRPAAIDLVKLLPGVYTTSASSPIGDVWTATGKDRDLVVLLCAGAPNFGGNLQSSNPEVRTAFVGLGKYVSPIFVVPIPNSRFVNIDEDPAPAQPFTTTVGAVMHELAHSLECGDEYDHKPEELPASREAAIAVRGNLAAESVLVTVTSGVKDLHLADALWGFFPRIRAAGVLASPLRIVTAPSGSTPGTYEVQLVPGQGKLFAGINPGEPMGLRARPLHFAMQFFAPDDRGRPRFRSVVSPDDFVLAAAPSGDTIRLTGSALPAKLQAALTAVPANRLFWAMLFAPTLGADGKPLLLTSKTVFDFIDTSDLPLNRSGDCQLVDPGAITGVISRDKRIPSRVPDELRNVKDNKFLSRIVGLMDGGLNFACGVFHPTGHCIMDRPTDSPISVPSKRFAVRSGGLVEFCHVCRYLIVDYLDPTLHAVIDDAYKAFYPVTP